jgi:hypothetical protein
VLLKDSNGRECDCKLDANRDGTLFVISACYVETGEMVPEELFEELERYNAERLDEEAFERAIMQAESAYEGER